jgi:hypothetical protein
MVAGDRELVGDEAASEEALGPEAIAVGSGLKLVLDEEVATERDGSGRRWRAESGVGW